MKLFGWKFRRFFRFGMGFTLETIRGTEEHLLKNGDTVTICNENEDKPWGRIVLEKRFGCWPYITLRLNPWKFEDDEDSA